MVPFVQTKSGINVYVDGKMQSIARDHPNYDDISNLVMQPASTEKDVRDLVDIASAVAKFSNGHIVISNETFKYDGVTMANALTRRILEMIKRGQGIDGLIKFMENLMENPSFRAVNELYSFLEACTLPITPDGYFLAYKKVNSSYESIHTNPDGSRVNNAIGQVCKMPRYMVDEDPNQTCSTGLHVCSFNYLNQYGSGNDASDRVVIVKVNPKDVVAVPTDYNNQKMRVCEYIVVSEIPNDRQTEIKDKYATKETYLSDDDDWLGVEDDDDEYEDDEDDGELECCDCDAEDCDSREAPYKGNTAKRSTGANTSTSSSALEGDWECRDRNDEGTVEFFSGMTSGAAKYKFAKRYGVPFVNVRVRRA